MIIKTKVETRTGQIKTAYYKHTSGGKPVCGSKGDAAHFNKEMAEKVLAQLKVIDHRFVEAEMVEA